MEWLENASAWIAAAVAFITGGGISTVLAYFVAWFKTRKLDPGAIADKVVSVIENTTIKVAVKESVEGILNVLIEKFNELIAKVEDETVIAKASAVLTAAVAEIYAKSDKLTDATKVAILNAKMAVDGVNAEKAAEVPDTAKVRLKKNTYNRDAGGYSKSGVIQ